MTHKHDPLIKTGSDAVCKTCGDLLPDSEQEIVRVSSTIRAIRTIDEIAVSGKYVANSFDNGFVVYSRDIGDSREEVSVQPVSARNYRVIKRIFKQD